MPPRSARARRHSRQHLRPWKPTEKQRAAAVLLHSADRHNILFDGGARSGKTESIIRFLATRAEQYPASQQIILRKIRRSAQFSVWESIVKHYRYFVPRDRYSIYNDDMMVVHANDSIVMVDGLDDSARLENILGTEYITIFVNEATQITYAYLNLLKSRLAQLSRHAVTGRTAPTKLIADCNPRHKRHWLYRMGVRNFDPTVLDDDLPLKGDARWARISWTPYDNIDNLPPRYIETHLDTLPAKLRARMKDGEWVNIEGCVYDNFDEDAHVIDKFILTPDYHIMRGIDFGYSNPFACLWLAVKNDYSHVVVIDEHYYTKHTVNWHAPRIKEKSRHYPSAVATLADWEAENRANLEEQGIDVEPADKALLSGIDRVYRALHLRGSNPPILQVCKNCVNTIAEFYSYRWPGDDTTTEQRLRSKRDEPVDSDNHALAAIRYVMNYIAEDMDLRSLLPTRSEKEESELFIQRELGGFRVPTVSWDVSYGKEGFGRDFF